MPSGGTVNRWVGIVNLLQAIVYGALAVYLFERWAPAGMIGFVAASAQVLGGSWLLWRGDVRGVRIASAIGLATAAAVVGLHLQVAVHLLRMFAEGGPAVSALLGGLAAALPWLAFFPLWQLLASRPAPRTKGSAVALALLGLAGPPASDVLSSAPEVRYPPVDGRAAATWLAAHRSGAPVQPPPAGAGPVVLVVTSVRSGAVHRSATVEGPDLPSALLEVPLELRRASVLYLDVAQEEGDLTPPRLLGAGPIVLRPGHDGLRTETGIVGTFAILRSKAFATRTLAQGVTMPAVRVQELAAGTPTRWVRMQSWLASEEGVVALDQTWAAPLPLDPDTLRETALSAARHLVHNMSPTGRYTYVVDGPSGHRQGGYNYPRHAGGTWFLARVATRTGDPEILAAAQRGMQFLADHTERTLDGRMYVLDPDRDDGKAWVGTTALALLAATEMGFDPNLQAGYAAWIASSVDGEGDIRGDMDRATGEWPEQPAITYGQGQGLLALVAAERAGVPGVTEALDRSAARVDGGYQAWPGSAFASLDEHWMCLAAAAHHEVRGVAAGESVCESYLDMMTLQAPDPAGLVPPAAGPAAGLAEAVIARAELDRRRGIHGRWLDVARDYGRILLDASYQPADAPMLGNPGNLIGGFRDKPWDLDVRVDAVQHIGCALLGLEQLLRGEELAGAMP
jgi:hypothetical protein